MQAVVRPLANGWMYPSPCWTQFALSGVLSWADLSMHHQKSFVLVNKLWKTGTLCQCPLRNGGRITGTKRQGRTDFYFWIYWPMKQNMKRIVPLGQKEKMIQVLCHYQEQRCTAILLLFFCLPCPAFSSLVSSRLGSICHCIVQCFMLSWISDCVLEALSFVFCFRTATCWRSRGQALCQITWCSTPHWPPATSSSR